MNEKPIILYRYVTVDTSDEYDQSQELGLEEYVVVRQTECFYYIKLPSFLVDPKPKAVGKKSERTFAYDTKEKALDNYIYRTGTHILYTERHLRKVNACYNEAKKLKEEGVNT